VSLVGLAADFVGQAGRPDHLLPCSTALPPSGSSLTGPRRTRGKPASGSPDVRQRASPAYPLLALVGPASSAAPPTGALASPSTCVARLPRKFPCFAGRPRRPSSRPAREQDGLLTSSPACSTYLPCSFAGRCRRRTPLEASPSLRGQTRLSSQLPACTRARAWLSSLGLFAAGQIRSLARVLPFVLFSIPPSQAPSSLVGQAPSCSRSLVACRPEALRARQPKIVSPSSAREPRRLSSAGGGRSRRHALEGALAWLGRAKVGTTPNAPLPPSKASHAIAPSRLRALPAEQVEAEWEADHRWPAAFLTGCAAHRLQSLQAPLIRPSSSLP
jgi:hypothetical protein